LPPPGGKQLFSLWACRTASRTELQAARFADDAARLVG
jgi:hypothetical protein